MPRPGQQGLRPRPATRSRSDVDQVGPGALLRRDHNNTPRGRGGAGARSVAGARGGFRGPPGV